ncbi:MAG: peptidylprolyl isomerase, partial [Bacteroidota bacterium]|nr:peptidylprolyl isomerase [Bacteroidota bacterium]
MKTLLLFFCLFFIVTQIHSQTLFTYGNKTVSKNEFLKAFEKNPSIDTTSHEASLKNYLDLYIKYKLKVQAALDEKLNQTDEYKSEADNFKKDLAETAMNNEANLNNLVSEAFLRSQKDIELAQVFVPYGKNGDTTAAFAKINEAYSLLKKGKPFTEVVIQFATDSAAKTNGGNIGFITVFTLPYDAENIVYNLKLNEFAKPYRSAVGYHIFKDVGEQPALGKRKVQTILFATSPSASESEKVEAKRVADSVSSLIQSGASFADLASVFNPRKKNGESAIEVSIGQYSNDFQQAVFALQKEGDVSKPFATAYGYNIVKLIEKEPAVGDTSDITIKAAMQEKLKGDERLLIAKQNLQTKWQSVTGYQPAVFNKEDLWKFTDTALRNGNPTLHVGSVGYNTVLFSFADKKITATQWVRFVQMKMNENEAKPNYEQWFPGFIRYATGNDYKENIEKFHPELKDQLREFNDANLLFVAMDKQVWSKASADTLALLKYYQLHNKKYKWMPGVSAIAVTANNKQIAGEIAQKIKEQPTAWRNIVDSYGSLAQGDSNRYEREQLLQQTDANLQT